jgi:hypothetical protein
MKASGDGRRTGRQTHMVTERTKEGGEKGRRKGNRGLRDRWGSGGEVTGVREDEDGRRRGHRREL